MERSFSLKSLQYWGVRGGFAILDQGIFSAGNFISNIILARWLLADQYGIYTIAFSAFVFFLQFLMSFILDPMGVLGPSNYNERLKDYIATQIRFFFALMVPIGILFATVVLIVGYFSGNPKVGEVLAMIGGSLSFLLLPWLLRRAFYILNRPDIAALGSIIYTATLILFIGLLEHFDLLSVLSSVVAVVLASLLSSIILYTKLGWGLVFRNIIPIKDIYLQNWTLGKWMVLSGVLITVAGQSQVFLSGAILGLEEAGALNAIQSLCQPMMLTITTIIALMTPRLAENFARKEYSAFKNKIIFMTIALILLALFFETLLILFRVEIEQIVFDGKYSSYTFLLPIFGIIPLILSCTAGLQAGFQASLKPQAFLVASAVWIVVAYSLGIWSSKNFGLLGLTLSTILGYLILAIMFVVLYKSRVYAPISLLEEENIGND